MVQVRVFAFSSFCDSVGLCHIFLLCRVRVVHWIFALENSVILSQLYVCLSVLSSRGVCAHRLSPLGYSRLDYCGNT